MNILIQILNVLDWALFLAAIVCISVFFFTGMKKVKLGTAAQLLIGLSALARLPVAVYTHNWLSLGMNVILIAWISAWVYFNRYEVKNLLNIK